MAQVIEAQAEVFQQTSDASSKTISFKVNPGKNLVLLVKVAGEGDGAGGNGTSGVTYDGVALTQIDEAKNATWGNASMWRMVAPPTGSFLNLVISVTGTDKFCGEIIVLANVDQTTPFGTPVKSTGSGTSVSNTVSSVGANDLVIDVLDRDNTDGTFTIGADQFPDMDTNAGSAASTGKGSYQYGSAGGVMSWSWSASRPYSHVAVNAKSDGESGRVQLLYGDKYDTTNTSTTAYVDCAVIPVGAFRPGRKYLIVANMFFKGSSASNDVNMRFVHGPNGSETDFTDGDWSRDPQGGSNGLCFGGIAVFTQPSTPEQVKLMIKMEATGTATADLGQLFAIDITDLTENTDYYFNEHTTDDTTMTTTYEDGASVTIVGNASDKWWVVGDVVRNTGSTTVSDHTRLNLDGNVDHTYINEGDDTTDKNAWLFSRSYTPDSSSVAKMQYGVESGTTGTYYSSRIFAINLALFDQFFAEDTTAATGSYQTNFVTVATESITPNVTGDWFYIGGFTHDSTNSSDNLQIRLQDNNTGSLVSNPGYGDDMPGVHLGDATDDNGFTIFYKKPLTSGASRTVNLDARDTVNVSQGINRTLVGFSAELAGGVETAGVSPVTATFSVPSTTATYQAVISAEVSPVNATLSVPSITATYVQVETAGVSPVTATFSVTSNSATYVQIETAGVAPVTGTFTVTSTTATYQAVLSAGVTPVTSTLSVPSTTATYVQVETAAASPVVATFSLPSVTATSEEAPSMPPSPTPTPSGGYTVQEIKRRRYLTLLNVG
jgi:hypothetical protein